MELAKNIRLKIGQMLLRKRMDKIKRKVLYSDFGKVKKIGIIWDASRVQDFIHLSGFFQKMNERNIEVSIMSYFPGKNLPDQYTAIRYLTCIRREDLNFFYLPTTQDAEKFLSTKFDILIDINFDNLLTLSYLSVLSSAFFKVGLYNNDKDGKVFDLMIELKNPADTGDFLNQTLHYLQMIHSEKAEIAH